MSKSQLLLQIIESHYSNLEKLYVDRSSLKVNGKCPPRDHKHYNEYRRLTKRIRKVRSHFFPKK